MVEMVIDSIRVSMMNYQRVVILKEKMADRYLPIWIGPSEADAIAVKLQGGNRCNPRYRCPGDAFRRRGQPRRGSRPGQDCPGPLDDR
ncbi:bifunctional nuclease family protein [Chloroflexota bacterium]